MPAVKQLKKEIVTVLITITGPGVSKLTGEDVAEAILDGFGFPLDTSAEGRIVTKETKHG